MPINFIPNDPAAGSSAPTIRVVTPRPNRPATKSGFTFTNAAPQGVANPGTPQFIFWQCREAALGALDAWEASAGTHTRWQGNRSRLALRQDDGEELNAFYDRASFSFFHKTVGTATFFSGASTDVVAHELGHGLLDSVRPDFFSVNFLEVGAFHEAFGDCIAILTALADRQTRQSLLSGSTNLRRRNFVEATAEDLSAGIGRAFPGHNAAAPRRAFNTFKFQIPTTLPNNGGPGALINEVHSFGMIFSGCFWDLIANLFNASPSKNEANLLAAAQLAGKILIAGARVAVITPRFLQSVGRAMMLADQSLHSGANQEHIRDAFRRHDILVGASVTLAPSMVLAGPAPKGRAAALSATTRKDLVQRLKSGRGGRVRVEAANVFGTRVANVVHTHDVPLGGLDSRLKGVVAVGHEPVLVGGSGGRASVMGVMPQAADTESEVKSFVEALLAHGRIEMGKSAKKKGFAAVDRDDNTTHAIKSVGGKKVLQRIRFRCGCCRCA